jgi:hypothetical protein
MPNAMARNAASVRDNPSATACSSTPTFPHNLIALLVIAGVIVCGGLALFGCGGVAGSFAWPFRQSLADPLRAGEWTIVAVKWRNESWTRPAGVGVGISGSGWSRPLLPDHAELAASEQAERDAARARRGGRPPIRQDLSSQFDKRTHRRRPAEISPPGQIDASAEHQPALAYVFALQARDKTKGGDDARAGQPSTWDDKLARQRRMLSMAGEADRVFPKALESEHLLDSKPVGTPLPCHLYADTNMSVSVCAARERK